MSRPVVVALMGQPGAGKTTIATALPDTVLVSRDALRARWPAPLGYAEADKAALFAAVLEKAARRWPPA